MKISYFIIIGLACLIGSYAGNIHAQARSNIGFGYSINKPYSGNYQFGRGFVFQGTIRVTDKIAIVPAIGYDHLEINRDTYDIPYSTSRLSNIDLAYFSIAAKYHFYHDVFAKAGPVLYAAGGNEDLSNAGIGGSAAIGYNLNLDNHSTLELTLNTTIINIPPQAGNGTISIASFKIAYAFNFRRFNN